MFGFVDQSIADAAGTGDLKAVQEYLNANPHQLDNRTLFQSNLLHIAARNGQAAIVEELVHRGSDLDALDFGGMRRTALHWACQGGHVRIVELLVDHGANTQVQGKAWSKLVQGKRCGRLIEKDAPFEDSPSSLCSSYSVRLALERPAWTPDIHYMFPARFKEVVRLMLLFQQSSRSSPTVENAALPEPSQAAGSSKVAPPGEIVGEECLLNEHMETGQHLLAHVRTCRQLDWDCLRDVFAMSAYPISAWL